MRKIITWIKNNLLFVLTLFLLMFIPLYPKIPIVDIKNTWVYVRGEDFVVLFVLFFWVSLLFRKKVTFKTPLTIPIMAFWIIGAIATTHGVVLLFPTLANVFPNVAFLSYIRHIEYMSLFFVAYASIRNKNSINYVIITLAATVFLISLYGIGQKYFGFPAFLTMNEEFAKGVGIRLSSLSRIPSTFAGHYDLAGYFVLVIPIFVSLIFGIRNLFAKFALFVVSAFAGVVLLMTVSRVSVFVLFFALLIVLLFQKKKLLFFVVPSIILAGLLFFLLKPTLLNRFNSTVRKVDVLVEAHSGDAIGEVKFIDSSYLKNKVIDEARTRDKEQVRLALSGVTVGLELPEEATTSPKLPLVFPAKIPLIRATNISTGENLPQGTGYINLSLAPVTRRLGDFFYELTPNPVSTLSAQVLKIHGSFLIKEASAYDLSFTTRFQGEWPRTMEAFKRNVFLGSGYGSVSLAVDNNYLRILGEIGLFGFILFFAIFLVFGSYAVKAFSKIDSKVTKSFVVGFFAGLVGLALNATLIDVFEASKIAFTLWLLIGFTVGILSLYQTEKIDIYKELKKVALSVYALVVYLLVGTATIFSPMLNNYFVGDDFTWFRWMADCKGILCKEPLMRIIQFLADSQGFFYRPGTKIYFYFMYSTFWLNQVVYHLVSVILHSIVVLLFFLLARKILKNNLLSAFAAFIFIIMSGYSEVVFWISSTGYLFNAVFTLSSILLFSLWIEKKKNIYYILSLLSIFLGMLFHENGIVIPLLIIVYSFFANNEKNIKGIFKDIHNILIFLPIPIYLIIRYSSNSHWFNGDYSYNLLKLPMNFFGNFIGYVSIIFFGPITMPIYEKFRNFAKENVFISTIVILAVFCLVVFLGKKYFHKITKDDKRIVLFGLLFSVISLLPFLGLGNITSRYSYLASLGLILIFVLVINKIYVYLKSYGREIAVMSMVIAISIFSLLHIIQVQQIHNDWKTAGDKTKKFLTSIDELYSDSWATKPIKMRFVNTPIKNGDAWVFPVGLEDAVWLSVKNDKIQIYQQKDLETALLQAGTSLLDAVFVFNSDGSVIEAYKDGFPIVLPPGVGQ